MPTSRIPRRVSAALLNSLSAGVVPRIGLEHVAVGRKQEVVTLLEDLGNVAEGAAAFRFLIGRYGSGKSFLLQLLRNYAMERGFVVADADLSPERRLAGSAGQGLATYRELMRNLATRTRPDGGALAAVLERWLANVQAGVVQETGLRPEDPQFARAVESRILAVVTGMENMVHGFDFAAVISAYWQGFLSGEDERQTAALRWLRGEFTTKTEARQALGVRVIVDDDSWYDYLKLLASFVSGIGYKGLLVLLDEGVNLYKISHTAARHGNYEKLLAMFNDTMQGKAEHLGIFVGGTPQFLEDTRRGLYSYEALRSRLAESRFSRDGLNSSGPVIRLQPLTNEEIYVLLRRLLAVFSAHYGSDYELSPSQLQAFMQEIANRLGADELLTPREVVRDFIAVLEIMRHNPGLSFEQIVQSDRFQPTVDRDPDLDEGGQFAEFTL